MYNSALLYCFGKTPAVMPSAVAMIPWRLDPRQPQEGVNVLKTYAVLRLRHFFKFSNSQADFLLSYFLVSGSIMYAVAEHITHTCIYI